jgi:hypothetical protein
VLNRSGDRGHPSLVLDFTGNGFSFSPLSIMLAVGLSYAYLLLMMFYKPLLLVTLVLPDITYAFKSFGFRLI